MIEDFNPWTAFLGGAVIGLGASLLWLVAGRIAGVSGILGNIRLLPDKSSHFWSGQAWRFLFLAGLPVGAIFSLSLGWAKAPSMPAGTWPILIAGGLLVGFGTRLGQGCTSGHGVCGLARRSRRSLVAVLVFMGVAALTVFVMRHVLGA